MKITEFLNPKAVNVHLKSKTKQELLEEMLEILIDEDFIDSRHRKKIYDVLMAREQLGSTAIGQKIYIPHGKSDAVKKLVACLGISKEGIDFDSLDGEKAHIFFMLIAPIDSAGPHLKALARISRLLKDKFIRDSHLNAKDEKTVMKDLQQEDDRLSQM